MKLNIAPSKFGVRLPVLIGDDLTVRLRPGHDEARLTPRNAIVLGARLIRQAVVADSTLVAPSRKGPATKGRR